MRLTLAQADDLPIKVVDEDRNRIALAHHSPTSRSGGGALIGFGGGGMTTSTDTAATPAAAAGARPRKSDAPAPTEAPTTAGCRAGRVWRGARAGRSA
ncbi:hypothetical protein [Bradyrhizobium canariense]|uniref:hypothetical protein n=1 Tax=Bradyrhizobium canariense TaxID=255045 RepID=UPI001CA4E234|nr:hypothetical protein [Bradyrhizobium canariense]